MALETHASMLVLVECDALDFAALAPQRSIVSLSRLLSIGGPANSIQPLVAGAGLGHELVLALLRGEGNSHFKQHSHWEW